MMGFFSDNAAARSIEQKVALQMRTELLADIPAGTLARLCRQQTTGPRTTNLAALAALKEALLTRGDGFASPADRHEVQQQLRAVVPCQKSRLLEELGVTLKTLGSPRFFGTIFERRVRVERFAHYALNTTRQLMRCDYEYGRGGSTDARGIALSNPNLAGTNRLVIVPSMHKALLHYQAQRHPSQRTRYVSLAGDFSPHRATLLRRVIKQLPPESTVELAFRFGADGHPWHETVEQILSWYRGRHLKLKTTRIAEAPLRPELYDAPPFQGLRLETRERQVLALEYDGQGCSGFDVLNYPHPPLRPCRGVAFSRRSREDRTLCVVGRMTEALCHYELCPDSRTRYACVGNLHSEAAQLMLRRAVAEMPAGGRVVDARSPQADAPPQTLLQLVQRGPQSLVLERRVPSAARPGEWISWAEALRAQKARWQ